MTCAPGSVLEASIEAVAGTGLDVVPEFFARFYEAWPEQRDDFSRPATTQGAMVNEMLAILAALATDDPVGDALIADCTARHHSYGAIAAADFTEAARMLMDTMQRAAGSAWRAEHTQVWSALLTRLRDAVDRAETVASPC
ncbi:globin [Novosphingobium piscinae]|uniref:Globin n=1 Tax=Novosphingobium piscinae TaxID=1507448 RepID=A0A7X1KRH2_9SPHN|nr:globin [Novosphingobium piscinae]MBC2670603.1 globin [Novosphingobium piscinae]